MSGLAGGTISVRPSRSISKPLLRWGGRGEGGKEEDIHGGGRGLGAGDGATRDGDREPETPPAGRLLRLDGQPMVLPRFPLSPHPLGGTPYKLSSLLFRSSSADQIAGSEWFLLILTFEGISCIFLGN